MKKLHRMVERTRYEQFLGVHWEVDDGENVSTFTDLWDALKGIDS